MAAEVLSLLVATFVATTWWALESGGVAIVRTQPAGGGVRDTRVWYTESDGELWLEAGSPENSWLVDVGSDPSLTFTADSSSRRYTAEPVDDPSGHPKIRALMREKYGFRDWWVGLIADTSRSVAVRLVARPDPPSGRSAGIATERL